MVLKRKIKIIFQSATARKQQPQQSIDTLASPLVSPTSTGGGKAVKSNKNDENNNNKDRISPQSSMLENVNIHDSTLFRVRF